LALIEGNHRGWTDRYIVAELAGALVLFAMCKIMMRAGTLCRLISLSPSEVSIAAEQTRSLSKALRPKAKCEFLYGRS
jgi:hypothetical protein